VGVASDEIMFCGLVDVEIVDTNVEVVVKLLA